VNFNMPSLIVVGIIVVVTILAWIQFA